MLIVDVRINNTKEIAHLRAVRIAGEPVFGSDCIYKIDYYEEELGTIKCRYGSGTELARSMLHFWDDNQERIEKVIKVQQQIKHLEVLNRIEQETQMIINNPYFVQEDDK